MPCTALSGALSSLTSALAFKTAPAMMSGSSNVVFDNVTYTGSTLSDTGAAANASDTAPFEGSDQGTSSGFSLTTSVTATQAAATCSNKAKGLTSIKVTKGTLTLQ